MTRRYLTYYLLLIAMVTVMPCVAQTIHPYGTAQMMSVADNELTGTTRFVGMSGAMTAVGGDPSAAKINPAGLGVYRHSQFSVSADGSFQRFWQDGSVDRGVLYSRWHLAQMSYVFALTHPDRLAGVVSNNIMISYAKRADFVRRVTLNDRNTRTAGADWIETTIDESGYRHDIDVHYAMNVSNRVYWGLGVTLEWLQVRQTIDRWEYTASDRRGLAKYYEMNETALGKAVGAGVSAGVLVHPVRALRIGLSVESPIFGQMRETDYYKEIVTYSRSSDMIVEYDSPDFNSRWKLATPLKASAGLGLQWKDHGLLSLQYDLQYHKLAGVSHTGRVGLEAAMTRHWMIEAGYAYRTLYARQNVSVGLHYMGNWLRIGVAYAYTWYNGMVKDTIYGTEQGLIRTSENRIVFTFQWNS